MLRVRHKSSSAVVKPWSGLLKLGPDTTGAAEFERFIGGFCSRPCFFFLLKLYLCNNSKSSAAASLYSSPYSESRVIGRLFPFISIATSGHVAWRCCRHVCADLHGAQGRIRSAGCSNAVHSCSSVVCSTHATTAVRSRRDDDKLQRKGLTVCMRLPSCFPRRVPVIGCREGKQRAIRRLALSAR